MPWVLDSQFPYQDPASDNQALAHLDSDSTPELVTDTPGGNVPSGDVRRAREDHFAMFVLFRSIGEDDIWVPLRVVRWGWCGRVIRGQDSALTLMGPAWKWRPAELRDTTGEAQYLLEVEETTQLPCWTRNTGDYDDVWDSTKVTE